MEVTVLSTQTEKPCKLCSKGLEQSSLLLSLSSTRVLQTGARRQKVIARKQLEGTRKYWGEHRSLSEKRPPKVVHEHLCSPSAV